MENQSSQANSTPPITTEPVSTIPPKPKGKLPLIIISGVLLLLLVGGGAYYLGMQNSKIASQVQNTDVQPTSTSQNNSVTNPAETPTATQIPQTDETTNWKAYSGTYVTFKYPNTWSPQKRELFGGATQEDVTLGIPAVESDQSLGFSGVSMDAARPNDIVSEKGIVIGGKNGYKWIRKGDNYVSYDYITKGYQDKGSFTVHVTISKEDKTLEKQLNTLVQSITFK